MNSKQAKYLRQQMREELNLDPTDAKYVERTWRYTEDLVPLSGAFLWALVQVRMPVRTISLHAGCGRAVYQKAKRFYKVLDKKRFV
jgi:hypothetical protein